MSEIRPQVIKGLTVGSFLFDAKKSIPRRLRM